MSCSASYFTRIVIRVNSIWSGHPWVSVYAHMACAPHPSFTTRRILLLPLHPPSNVSVFVFRLILLSSFPLLQGAALLSIFILWPGKKRHTCQRTDRTSLFTLHCPHNLMSLQYPHSTLIVDHSVPEIQSSGNWLKLLFQAHRSLTFYQLCSTF